MPLRALMFDTDGEDTDLSQTQRWQRPSDHQLLWIDLLGEAAGEGLTDLELTPKTLARLDELPDERPLLRHHGHYVEINVKAAGQGGQHFSPLIVVAGERFVVTAHREEIGPLSDLMKQAMGDTQIGKLDSAAFLAVLLGRLLESYFTAISDIEECTDVLDERLLQNPDDEPLEDLTALRRRVGVLRRELASHRPLFMHLASPDFVVYAGDERESQLTALLMQFEHALDSVLHTRELVLGSFNLYMTSLSQRTNEVMRLLTVITLSLGILAAIAGLMGMNFEANVFKLGDLGFWGVLALSLLLSAVVVGLGRKRRWW